jgi:hypothetical protein
MKTRKEFYPNVEKYDPPELDDEQKERIEMIESEYKENLLKIQNLEERLAKAVDQDEKDSLQAEINDLYRITDENMVERQIMGVVGRADLFTTEADKRNAENNFISEMRALTENEFNEIYHKDKMNEGAYTLEERKEILDRLTRAQHRGEDTSNVVPQTRKKGFIERAFLNLQGYRGGKSKKRRTRKRRNSRCKI